MRFSIYRFNPETDKRPHMQAYELPDDCGAVMLLDALVLLKQQDDGIGFRRSCREGVCGSDGMNINGRNGLACITPLKDLKQPIELRPLPGVPVIRDLIVDLTQFYTAYRAVKPWVINHDPEPEIERLQSPEERDKLDGLYECILCACCTTACPSFWWNPDKFLGPAALLQAWRFLADSRDQATGERLDDLEDPYKLFRCHTIMNCTEACPKGLNPAKAIGHIKMMLAKARPLMDERRMERLRWRCRRGLLELDVVLKNFLDQGYTSLTPAEQDAFDKLLAVPDNILWAYVQGSENPPEKELSQIVSKIRK